MRAPLVVELAVPCVKDYSGFIRITKKLGYPTMAPSFFALCLAPEGCQTLRFKSTERKTE